MVKEKLNYPPSNELLEEEMQGRAQSRAEFHEGQLQALLCVTGTAPREQLELGRVRMEIRERFCSPEGAGHQTLIACLKIRVRQRKAPLWL